MLQRQVYIIVSIILIHFSNNAFAKQKTLSKIEITSLVSQATHLMKVGKYDQSLTKSRHALAQSKAINDYDLIATCYNTIAANLDELNYPDKALFYYNKSLFYADKTNNDNLKNKLNNNLGNIYCFDKKQFEIGFNHYKKSIALSTKIKDSSQIYFTTINLIWACFDNKLYKKGLPYLNFANKFQKKFGDSSNMVNLNMLNGLYSSHINKNKEANSYFLNAIKLGLKGDDKSDLSFAYLEYSKFLVKIGHYKKAYEYLEIYSKIYEEMFNEQILATVNAAGVNLELDESKRDLKRVENGFKQKQYLLQEKASKKQKIFIIIIGLCILSAIMIYFFFQNTKLKQKNKLNKLRSKLQLKVINATFDGQEIERKKIAAFLHDNISSKLSSAGLQLSAFSAINKIDAEEIKKSKEIIKEIHDEIRNLSHELLPTLLVKFGLFYSIQDLCKKNSNTLIQFEYSSAIVINQRYQEDFETKIFNIISELFNNILKHSEASKVKVAIEENNNILTIILEDNGKGFKTTKTISNEGFGLTQIRARVSSMDGKFSVNSIVDKGTLVIIIVPIQEKN
ncbi:ATP-binding protein [Flavobacterium luteum]|uniref:histidine kinase n=1 Tax=Flavobacterium luteum TaxID=2026654 RepID=A0A7J5AJ46_9FLAO|nr:tetratricopeptide repeat-containing sensor histidine kinase [Flavobacterium luteum]KAB1157637.1 tetratricopeptide repeat protein [Flavobacterium luteum]